MRDFTIITGKTYDEYMAYCGDEYNAGDLWDYPLEEMEVLTGDAYWLIDNRLYETPKWASREEQLAINKTKKLVITRQRELYWLNEYKKCIENYPYNIYDYMLQSTSRAVYYEPEFYEEKIYEALNHLTERERAVMDCYFKDGLNLEQTGNQLGVTRERIRQVIVKACRKIRWYLAREEEIKKQNELIEAENKRVEICKEALELLKVNEPITEEMKAEIYQSQNAKEQKRLAASILDIDLSVRSYNCLLRAGIKTVGDILSKNIEDLMRVRNLGRKSLKEITDKMKEYGYEIDYSTGNFYKIICEKD